MVERISLYMHWYDILVYVTKPVKVISSATMPWQGTSRVKLIFCVYLVRRSSLVIMIGNASLV